MTTMSRAHFELVAATVKALPREFDTLYWKLSQVSYRYVVAIELANALERTNPRFDRDRFLLACGAVVKEVP